MATRPIRLPSVRWGSWLLIVVLVGILIGCGRKEDPPAVVEGPKPVEEDKKLTNEDVGFDADGVTVSKGEREGGAVRDQQRSDSSTPKQLGREKARLEWLDD